MHLLEKQDRTERQLYDKLKQNGYPESCIESAIAYVKSYHYIDDFRYASTYIRYHQEKKSRQKLKMELMAKGIGRDLVDAALEEEYVSDDQKKIAELLQKRHYSFEDADVSVPSEDTPHTFSAKRQNFFTASFERLMSRR